MWDPHVGPAVEMGWAGRVVVDPCFRNMGTVAFKEWSWLVRSNKGIQISMYFPQVQVFFGAFLIARTISKSLGRPLVDAQGDLTKPLRPRLSSQKETRFDQEVRSKKVCCVPAVRDPHNISLGVALGNTQATLRCVLERTTSKRPPLLLPNTDLSADGLGRSVGLEGFVPMRSNRWFGEGMCAMA